MVPSTVLLLLLGWYGGIPKTEFPKEALLTVSEGPCFGTCPAFDLVIFKDGRVEFDGHSNVRIVGKKHSRIPRGQISKINEAIKTSGFDKLQPEYPCGWTDNPATTICVGSSSHCVTYEPFHSNPGRGGPRELTDLVALIEATASVAQWVQTDKHLTDGVEEVLYQHFAIDEATAPWPIHSCFELASGEWSPDAGCQNDERVTLNLSIDAKGHLVDLSAQNPDGKERPEIAKCLTEKARDWSFPARATGTGEMAAKVIWSTCSGLSNLDVQTK